MIVVEHPMQTGKCFVHHFSYVIPCSVYFCVVLLSKVCIKQSGILEGFGMHAIVDSVSHLVDAFLMQLQSRNFVQMRCRHHENSKIWQECFTLYTMGPEKIIDMNLQMHHCTNR